MWVGGYGGLAVAFSPISLDNGSTRYDAGWDQMRSVAVGFGSGKGVNVGVLSRLPCAIPLVTDSN